MLEYKIAGIINPLDSLVTHLRHAFTYLISKYLLSVMQKGHNYNDLANKLYIIEYYWRIIKSTGHVTREDVEELFDDFYETFDYRIESDPQDDFDRELSGLLQDLYEEQGAAEIDAINDFLDDQESIVFTGSYSPEIRDFSRSKYLDPKEAIFLEKIVARKPRGLTQEKYLADASDRVALARLSTAEYGVVSMVVFIDDDGKLGSARRSRDGSLEMTINLYDLVVRRGNIREFFSADLMDTISHELVHFEQFATESKRGWPSKSRGHIRGGDSASEFYPHLRDEVARFKRRYPRPTNDQIRTYIQDTSVFFDMLRDDPKFFKKAVGLFYEAVTR